MSDHDRSPNSGREPSRSASIFSRASIDDVLRLAQREPVRRNYFRCPSHADRTPSAHVSKDRRAWYCHGCRANGGVAELILRLGEAKDRASAAQWLEKRLG
jgi:hypothetical protein